MTRIVADDVLRARLQNMTDPLEICDAEGRLLGRFVPAEENERDVYRDMEWPEDLTPEEIHRRWQQGGGKPLAQIWKELGRT